jgi:hypothetical protein
LIRAGSLISFTFSMSFQFCHESSWTRSVHTHLNRKAIDCLVLVLPLLCGCAMRNLDLFPTVCSQSLSIQLWLPEASSIAIMETPVHGLTTSHLPHCYRLVRRRPPFCP